MVVLKLEGERNPLVTIFLDFLANSLQVTLKDFLLKETEIVNNLPDNFVLIVPISQFSAELLNGSIILPPFYHDRCLEFYINAGHFLSLSQLCQMCLSLTQQLSLTKGHTTSLKEEKEDQCKNRRINQRLRQRVCKGRRASH